MKDREKRQFELDKPMIGFLEEIAKKYQLPSTDKALRCLINYARERADRHDEIFGQIRCPDC
jgi:hypothetical protein